MDLSDFSARQRSNRSLSSNSANIMNSSQAIISIVPANRAPGYAYTHLENITLNNEFGPYIPSIYQRKCNRQLSLQKMESFMAQNLRHAKHVLKENYSQLIKTKQNLVRQGLEQYIEKSLNQTIQKIGQPIIRILPLTAENKISWVTAHTLINNNSLKKPHQRSYSQFVEPRLLSRMENYLIGRLGEKRGQEKICKMQQMFKTDYCAELEIQINNAKQELSRILHLIYVKIIENQEKRIQRIDLRLGSN